MLNIENLPRFPFRQKNTSLCMLFSYASSLYPFIQIGVNTLLSECSVYCGVSWTEGKGVPFMESLGDALGVPRDANGYTWLETLHYKCPTNVFDTARKRVRFKRISSTDKLESYLKYLEAAALVSFSVPSGIENHSVAIVCDKSRGFVVRDSATCKAHTRYPVSDATGSSISEAITILYPRADIGESIMISRKKSKR